LSSRISDIKLFNFSVWGDQGFYCYVAKTDKREKKIKMDKIFQRIIKKHLNIYTV